VLIVIAYADNGRRNRDLDHSPGWIAEEALPIV
jgi:hypothetical protein